VPGYEFTHEVRRALQAARQSAARAGFARVEPVHLLVGITEAGGSVTSAIFDRLGTSAERAVSVTEVRRGGSTPADEAAAELPYTGPAKRALEVAMTTARRLGHNYVGCEHLLVGLTTSPLAGRLRDVGLSKGAVEDALRAIVPASAKAKPSSVAARPVAPLARLLAVVVLISLAAIAAAVWAAIGG
jgi:ATP-dependent Clp protease ATP-binding subunit ClpA